MQGIIIGGGIGGLTAAIALQKHGIECQVFEATPKLEPVGAGIWMAVNAMQVFERLGLAGAILSAGIPLKAIQIADQQLNILHTSDMDIMRQKYGFSTTAIHRGILQQCLLHALPSDRVHTGKRFQSFEQTGDKIRAFFEDGSETTGDFLIGADGIHSAVREQLFPHTPLRYSGQTCWRGVAEISLKPDYKNRTIEVWGDNGRFGFSEIENDRIYWYADRSTPPNGRDVIPGVKKQLQGIYQNYASPLPEILAATAETDIIRSDISDLKPIPNWWKGQVCLLGDAAHATTPNLGQGGGQAVEDGLAIALCLSQSSDISAAFKNFQNMRMPKVHLIVNTSWRFGKMAHIHSKTLAGLRNFLTKHSPTWLMNQQFDRIYRLDF